MGESRTELLAWLNDLLQLGYTKIEQCGTGAAHCQIMDSVFKDVPLNKVKFNAKQEYEYINNFKVLQASFDKHKINQAIPVERLAKCKFQDNLEFLQWVKRYWDQYYPGGQYDALMRRKGSPEASRAMSPPPSKPAAVSKPASNMRRINSKDSVEQHPAPRPASNRAPVAPSSRGGARSLATTANAIAPQTSSSHGGGGGNNSNWERERAQLESEYGKMMNELTQQTMELKVTVEQVEKEREFYFGKLREIEIFVQSQLDNTPVMQGNPEMEAALKEVQAIMYKTEDGFAVPDSEENLSGIAVGAGGGHAIEQEMY